MASILVIQHVAHERLGSFEPALKRAGCTLVPRNIYDRATAWPALDSVDGIISMGGPQSVYQQAKFPWIKQEVRLLREAVQKEIPVLGVCLGAQLLAAALGAKVMPAPVKEIGWHPVMRELGADGDPMFGAFGPTETVFQWHGDTFELPQEAIRLASSPLCQEQGFRYGSTTYALQFHVEVTETLIRAWMQTPVNRRELASLKGAVDPMAIRRQSRVHVGRLGELAAHVADTFASMVRQAPRRAIARAAARPGPGRVSSHR